MEFFKTVKEKLPEQLKGILDTVLFSKQDLIQPSIHELLKSQQLSVDENSKTRVVKLIEKHTVSRDCVLLKFKYIGFGKELPIGKHIKVIIKNPNFQHILWNNENDSEAGKETIERKYTPISVQKDGFSLIVKVYSPNEDFPSGGKASQYLNSLIFGNQIIVELPFGLIEYFGEGCFKKSKIEVKVKEVGMIAAGSGITPMIRLLNESLSNSNEFIKFSLIFSNRNEDDIVFRNELDLLLEKHPDRLKVCYTLTNPSEKWIGNTGRVNKELIQKDFVPLLDSLVLVCGPSDFIKYACKANLIELGYDSKLIWEY